LVSEQTDSDDICALWLEVAMDRSQVDELQAKLAANYSRMQAMLDEQTRAIFDRTRDYNNTVVTIGYASFFAIWAFTRDQLPASVSLHVALCMGLSIFLFVIFVVIDMLFLTFVTVQFSRKLRHKFDFRTLDEAVQQSEAHATNAEQFQKQVRVASLSILVVWPFFFLPSLGLGVYAALLLMYNFLALQTQALPLWPT
jgi:hypothetical protein